MIRLRDTELRVCVFCFWKCCFGVERANCTSVTRNAQKREEKRWVRESGVFETNRKGVVFYI